MSLLSITESLIIDALAEQSKHNPLDAHSDEIVLDVVTDMLGDSDAINTREWRWVNTITYRATLLGMIQTVRELS